MEKVARSITGPRGKVVRLLGPVAAVAAANVANIGLMRQNEFLEGVEVMDEDGVVLGKSKKAGIIGVGTTIAGRVLSTLAPLTFTPVFHGKLMGSTFGKRNPVLDKPSLLLIITAMIGGTVPFALGVFKQHTSWNVNVLEERFSGLKRVDGRPVVEACWNRGM